LCRCTSRPASHTPLRRLNRACLRALPGHRRTPDGFHLSEALTAFRRAIRSHRRLARLAPRFFDSAVVDREALERAERRRWAASWEPALAKAYGCQPAPPPDPAPDLPAVPQAAPPTDPFSM